MNLSIFWRLQDLVSPSLQKVMRTARQAQTTIGQANQAVQKSFRDSGETVNSLRQKIDALRATRDSLRINVDTRQITAANRELDALQRKLDNVEGKTKKDGWFSSGGLKTGIAALGISVGAGALGGFAQLGMDREMITTQFEQFTKDQKQAVNLVKELNKYADATPYLNDDTLKIGSKIAMNFSPAEVLDKVRMIGDIAGGNAGRMESIQLALSQTKALGHLQGQELNQFADALVPLREYLAKIKGVKADKIMKMVEDRKISYEDVERALKAMTSEGGIFFGFMDKLAKTTQGKWSTLVGSVKNKLTELSMAQTGWLNRSIDWANRFLSSMQPVEDSLLNLWNAFQPLFSSIRELLIHVGLINPAGDSVQQIVSLLSNVFNILATAIRWASTGLKWLVNVFNAIPFSKYIAQFLLLNFALKSIGVFKLISGIASLGSALMNTAGIVGILQKVWIALNTTFVLSPIGLIVTAILGLIAAIYYAWTECEKFREVVIGVWGGIKEVWGATVGWLIDKIVFLWNNLKGAWSDGATGLGTILRAAVAIASFGISEVIMYAIQNWEKLKAAIVIGSRVLLGILTLGVSEFVIRNWDKLKAFWDKFKNYAVDAIKGVITAMFPLLSLIARFTKDKFMTGYNKAVNDLNNNKGLDNWYNTRDDRSGNYIPKVPGVPGVPGGLGSPDGSTKGGGITDTVEGARSKSIVINLNKGLIETSNIIVDSKGTGLDIERKVVEALNRILLSGERLAYE